MTGKTETKRGKRGNWARAILRAQRAADRNKARIESGETFRARKPSDWRRGGKRREPNR